MKLRMLGSGVGLPNVKRRVPWYYLNINNENILIDRIADLFPLFL